MILGKYDRKTCFFLTQYPHDAWGRYTRLYKESVTRHERFLKETDDGIYRTKGSYIMYLYYKQLRRREPEIYSLKESGKKRKRRTRKILQLYYENLDFHSIQMHMKKSHIKNGLPYTYNFYKMLERRLDVMCLRTYLYTTLKEAKEYISNGFITVNNKIIKSCNYILKDKDIFSVRPDLRYNYKVKYLDSLRSGKIFRRLPPYLYLNINSFEVSFISNKFQLENIPHLAKFPWMRFPNQIKKP